MILANFSWIVCLFGLLLYIAANSGKEPSPRAAEVGRVMFAMGLLAGLIVGVHHP